MFINPSVPDIMKTLAIQLAAKGLEAKDIDKIGTVGRGGEGVAPTNNSASISPPCLV